MPRKAFIADLQKAASGNTPPGISNVRRGDDDGQFIFCVTSPFASQASIELTGSISDVSDYPGSHTCMFFAPEDAPEAITRKLEKLSDSNFGKSILELLDLFSKSAAIDSDGDTQMPDSQAYSNDELPNEDDEDDDFEAADDFFPDEPSYQTSLPGSSQGPPHTLAAGPTAAVFRERVRSDLKVAKEAGFKIGNHGPILDGSPGYITISCRVSKLGISEQAMQAWRLHPSEYLILLLHYPYGYRNVDALMSSDSTGKDLEIRVGVSHTYKPTFQETVRAFSKTLNNAEPESALRNEGCGHDESDKGFRNSFISAPLHQLFNERLVKIVKFRHGGMSWTGAEEFLNDHMASTFRGGSIPESKYLVKDTINHAYPPLVNADHISEAGPTRKHSLPLIAMQFLLRHFVRCTEFCLVCFRRLPNDLEAIKPYVCENPLCLYQYMSLGFGPRIEHEILTQPYVADLLISLCQISARSHTLKDFPNGLSLMVPPNHALPPSPASEHGFYNQQNLGSASSLTAGPEAAVNAPPIKIRLNYPMRELLFDNGSSCPVKAGDWILVKARDTLDRRIPGTLRLHYRVLDTSLFPTIQLSDATISSPSVDNSAGQHTGSDEQAVELLPAEFVDAEFFIYNRNFDELSSSQKQEIIYQLLSLLPSVMEMRSYLLSKPNASLSTWSNRISPALVGLLRWIIASSRACIMQLDSFEQATEAGAKHKHHDERVYGMNDWVQFKFAMGAPDKERRFVNAVKSTAQRLNLKHPTLFAWHGSPLPNWHSIIREGLHYKKIAHGRAFGDGVYHSLHSQTSLGYSNFFAGRSTGWNRSLLNVTQVLALNEIVNAPEEYRSSNPHLVVQHLDWIQTRYLFVKVGSQEKLNPVSKPTVFHEQDPRWTPVGDSNQRIIIPRTLRGQLSSKPPSAQPTQTPSKKQKTGIFTSKLFKGTGKQQDPGDIEGPGYDDAASVASIETLAEDLEIFKAEPAPTLQKSSKPMTDFKEGTLDHSTLPLLEPPSWASAVATKRLQQDFKALLKVQEQTPLHELGWYVDPEQVNNIYQWIVELHSFESKLPLAKGMKEKGINSIVLELRFGKEYPHSPPFVRVIRPRFLSFQQGGGGHVTAGGALCMELLTNSGWTAISSIEAVLLQIRLAMSSTDPHPARLELGPPRDYGIGEAIEAYQRACRVHGWTIPPDFKEWARGAGSSWGM